ncbi:NAD-P-binding protein [Laetiporus sulphureus 93-53]|uniref:NAD-P-binding protein n=1 Tax=Laetiporus sulphureus 93-53 TaxID=1314785 RepID=A0A165D2L1_9APHY|nr:NAD-P-binding protein [Laetiporus sulphureus 93-53]KZT04032.1 NAD-P-binding protein [Laetiporus sulphureus 93-53]
MSLVILTASDVANVTSTFSPTELTELMARVFFHLSKPPSAKICQPHRANVSMLNHTALFMPSRLYPMGTAVKIVSVPSASAPQAVKEGGLPATSLVLDEQSGGAKVIVNARSLTALRNAAGSLLATRLLYNAEEPPKTLLALGAGAQVAAHISLFLTAYPTIRSCFILNRSQNKRLEDLATRARTEHPAVNLQIGTLSQAPNSDRNELTLEKAVRSADIIITATSSTVPLFPSEHVKSGTHLCLIGSYTPQMHEVDGDLVKRAGKIVVDSKFACLSEAGELISANLGESDLVELGELLHYESDEPADGATYAPRTEMVRNVRNSGEVTIFKSVGVGVQDVAIAAAVVDRANSCGVGLKVDNYDGNV